MRNCKTRHGDIDATSATGIVRQTRVVVDSVLGGAFVQQQRSIGHQ